MLAESLLYVALNEIPPLEHFWADPNPLPVALVEVPEYCCGYKNYRRIPQGYENGNNIRGTLSLGLILAPKTYLYDRNLIQNSQQRRSTKLNTKYQNHLTNVGPAQYCSRKYNYI